MHVLYYKLLFVGAVFVTLAFVHKGWVYFCQLAIHMKAYFLDLGITYQEMNFEARSALRSLYPFKFKRSYSRNSYNMGSN